MKPKNQSRTTDYSSEDIARRRDDAIRRALNTPPKPYKDSKVGQTKPVRKPPAAKK